MKMVPWREVSVARRIPFGIAVLVSALAAASGCNGSGSGGSCGKVQPCGGSVVGEWMISSSCIDPTALNTAIAGALSGVCPTATATAALNVTGNATFTAAGTYSLTSSEAGTATVAVPPACLMQGGLTLTCAQVGPAIMLYLLTSPNALIQGVTCAPASSGCSCMVAITPMMTAETGTYSTVGTTLAETPSTGSPSTTEYCASGGDLHLISVDTSMPTGTNGKVRITADIVLKNLKKK